MTRYCMMDLSPFNGVAEEESLKLKHSDLSDLNYLKMRFKQRVYLPVNKAYMTIFSYFCALFSEN